MLADTQKSISPMHRSALPFARLVTSRNFVSSFRPIQSLFLCYLYSSGMMRLSPSYSFLGRFRLQS